MATLMLRCTKIQHFFHSTTVPQTTSTICRRSCGVIFGKVTWMCFDRKIAINKYNTDTGCIINMVKIVDCVTKHKSPYFGGPYGWVAGEAIGFD